MTIVVWPLAGEESQLPMLRIPHEWIGPITAAAGDVPVVAAPNLDAALAAAPDATGWIGALTPELFAAAPRLRWLQAPTISLEALEFPALNASAVEVTNLRNIYDDHIATHVVAMFLAHCRQLPRFWRQQQRHEWISGYVDNRALDPADLTIVIQGVGGIGAEIARRLVPFGPHVIGVDPELANATADLPVGVHRLVRPDAFDALLPEVDAVIVAAPQTPETLGSWDEARFRAMKPSAYFVNIGRGPIVRTDALARALGEGWIAAAAIDVVDPEPIAADSPLWDLDNLMITPHSAGAGPHVAERRLAVVTGNVRRFVTGEPLQHVVDLARGY